MPSDLRKRVLTASKARRIYSVALMTDSRAQMTPGPVSAPGGPSSRRLIAGMLAWGLVGWLADQLVGTDHVFLGIGIVLGGASGMYIVYLRYGKDDRDDGH